MSICSRLISRTSVFALVLLGSSAHFTFAAAQNRINASVQDGDRVSLEKNVPPRARLSIDLGEAQANQVLSSVGLHFDLTDAQQADLSQLLIDSAESQFAALSSVAHAAAVWWTIRPIELGHG